MPLRSLSSPAPRRQATRVRIRLGLVAIAAIALCMPAAAAAAPRLVSYRVIKHRGYDRVVWQFAGGLPGHQIEYVRQVVSDGSGKPVRLEGHAFLNVTLKDLEWTGRDVPREPTLTPRLHLLRQLKPSGVFEGYFSFGLGLSHKARYRFFTLRRPDRAVLDLLY